MLGFRNSIFFVLILFGTLRVSATDVSFDSQVMTIYKDHFYKYDTLTNMPWDCGGNSYDLYKQIYRKIGNVIQPSFIVHAFYEKEFKLDRNNRPLSRLIVPKKPRAGHSGWAFHAFLVINGFVFDQYFTNNPMIIKLDSYFLEMWGKENFKDLKFQVIPTSQYEDVVNRGYYPSAEYFPVLDIQQAKNFIQKSQ